jgi:diamine N-acetyltransferase
MFDDAGRAVSCIAGLLKGRRREAPRVWALATGPRQFAVQLLREARENAPMPRVQLRDVVTAEDRATVVRLRLAPGQDEYLNSMPEIFDEADEEQRAMPHPWAVHDAATGVVVGFAMISDNIPPPMDDDLVGPYYLWKLLIDEAFQRRGYGVATIDAVVEYLRTRPGADVLYTSCADGPGSPRGFYLHYGFTDTGRVMWGENVLALDLTRHPRVGAG